MTTLDRKRVSPEFLALLNEGLALSASFAYRAGALDFDVTDEFGDLYV